jgi:hypothetical protein
MKWFEFQKKPGWTSRDAGERIAAVRAATDADIAGALPALITDDPDAAVRAAALARSSALSLVAARVDADPDPAVREAARKRLAALLIEPATDPATLAAWIESATDADLLRQVAERAESATARRAALLRIDRPALIAERCQRDPDPALRLELLDRITDIGALERIAEATRRNDKRLAHAARERAEALRLAGGDLDAWRRRTLTICERLDALRRDGRGRDDAEVSALAAEWDVYATRLDAEYGVRVRGYLTAFDPPPAPAPAAIESGGGTSVDDAATASPAPTVPTQAPEPAAPPEPDREFIALVEAALTSESGADAAGLRRQRLRIDARYARIANPTSEDRDAHARFVAHLDARLAELEAATRVAVAALATALDALAAAISAGHAGEARRARRGARSARDAAGAAAPVELKRRMEALEAEHDRLARWQHWSNNKVRARLCDEFEAWLATRPHPDAVATRVRDLKNEWTRLDALEHDADEACEPSGLDRRLRALTHRALAPARQYFDKRKTLRGEKHEAIERVLAEPVPSTGDVRGAIALRRRVTDALRELDQVDPAARGDLGKRLRARLDELDALRAAGDTEAAEARRKLIAQTRRALAQAKLAEALAIARDAQEKLRALPRASRAHEAELSAEFEALVAPWFAKAEAERAGRDAVAAAEQAEFDAVLAELARLAAAEETELRHADTQVQALRQRWEAARAAAASADEESTRGAGHGRDRGQGSARGHARGDRDGDRERRPRPAPRRPDPRERRLDDAVAAVERAVAAMRARQGEAERRQLTAAAAWCSAVEAALLDASDGAADAAHSAASMPWPLSSQQDALARELERRRARALEWAAQPDPAVLTAAHAQARERAQTLAIRSEIARGLASPEACRAERRALEVSRLQARLAGGAAVDAQAERAAIAREWLLLGPLSAAEREAYARRIEEG